MPGDLSPYPIAPEGESHAAFDLKPAGKTTDFWSGLPRVSVRQVRLERRLAGLCGDRDSPQAIAWLADWLGGDLEFGTPEVLWRASGLHRPGLIAQFRWPRLRTRLAIGLETALAHALVDRLLGYSRPLAESRLQITPVEWGIASYLAVRALEELDRPARLNRRPDPAAFGALGACDLSLDRVGPDPYDTTDLGEIVTVRWPVRLGSTTAALRIWLAGSLVGLWLASPSTSPPRPGRKPLDPRARDGELTSTWHAEAGSIEMAQGLSRLRAGGVQPLVDSRLVGTPRSPSGPVDLVCQLTGTEVWLHFPAESVAGTAGRILRLTGPCTRRPRPRDPSPGAIRKPMNPEPTGLGPGASSRSAPTNRAESTPPDVPVTLTVELGRVNLTLSRLADLAPGDVIELGRHSREPIELTSGGRLVARGELILIDTELGVRVTNVLL